MARILIGSSTAGKALIHIGIRIPKVPHEVPVEKARKIEITKIISGQKKTEKQNF